MNTLTVLLLLIYMKRLAAEFQLDFRVRAYACFCTFREIKIFKCFMADAMPVPSLPPTHPYELRSHTVTHTILARAIGHMCAGL